MTWVSRLACVGTLPSRDQFLRKPLPLSKIACESTVPYTTDSNNAPGIHIEVNSGRPLYIMLISIFVVCKRCYCEQNCLVIIPNMPSLVIFE